MDMSKFLTEIRKIVREEISIALDDVSKNTDKRIAEVLSKRLLESKKQKQAAPQTSKPQPKAKSDKDLVRQVRESLNTNSGTAPRPVKNPVRQVERRAEELLPPVLQGLPSHLREALAQTTEDLITGASARLGGDVSGASMMYEGMDPSMFADDDMGEYDSNDHINELGEMQQRISGVPAFLQNAISNAGAVAKRAEEFSKNKAS